ncbi:MAG: tetratricopeptide repeat protein [Candidatus Omnitrophica bacterium]|nr:tetratricopeptide repeat protein [Candidatus Omnitrophota bacterium]
MIKIKNNIIILVILLAITGLIVHKDALKTPLFWDDEVTILDNIFIRDAGFLKQIFTSSYHSGAGDTNNLYRPLATLSFLAEYHIWKFSSLGFHLTNLLLHVMNGLLVFFLLLALLKDKKISFFASLLFLIHPVQTEVVNYASHRPELLMTLFLLASFTLYLKFTKLKNYLFLLLSSFFFALSILSKEMGLVLILFIFLYNLTNSKKNYLDLLPFIIIAAIYILLRATLLNFLNVNIITQGAQISPYSQKIAERLLIFAKIFFTYLKILFVPLDLHMERDIPYLAGSYEIFTLLKAFIIVSLIIGLLTRGRKPIFFWADWFMAGLLPVSGIIPINTAIAEHYLYLPSIGLFATCSYFLCRLYTKIIHRRFKAALIILALILFTALGLLSAKRNKEWNTPLTLYLSTIKNTKNSFRCNNNMGVEYFRKGDLKEAEYYFRESLKILPTYSPALNNMGVIAQRKGKTQEAIKFYKKALENDRDYLLAYKNLYPLYIKLDKLKEARQIMEKILEIFPYDKETSFLLDKIRAYLQNYP